MPTKDKVVIDVFDQRSSGKERVDTNQHEVKRARDETKQANFINNKAPTRFIAHVLVV